ncbi:MAG: ATP-binding protein [Spirosomataceae bacterium]
MKKTLLIILLFTNLTNASKIDSLKTKLSESVVANNDTLKIQIFCKIADLLITENSSESIIYIQKALELSDKIKYEKGRLKANLLYAQKFRGSFLKSSSYLQKALAIAEKNKFFKEAIEITNDISVNYGSTKDYDKALKYSLYNSELCQKFGTKEEYLMSLNILGAIYFEKNDTQKAYNYFLKCEELNKELKSQNLYISTLINIANIYFRQKKFDPAIERLKKALTVNVSYNDRISYPANLLAKIYLEKREFENAQKYARMAYLGNPNSIYSREYTTLTLSEVFSKMKRYDSAHYYLQEHLKIKNQLDSSKSAQVNRLMVLDYESEKQFQEINDLSEDVLVEKQKKIMNAWAAVILLLAILIILYFLRSVRQKNKEIEKQKQDIEQLNNTLEWKVEERTKELSEANKALTQLNKEISEALAKGQSIERERMASELHDNIGSIISGLKFSVQSVDKSNLKEADRLVYDGIFKKLEEAYNDVRLLSHNLLPTALNELGLIGALEKITEEYNKNYDIYFRLKVAENIPNNINSEISLELYSCCYEAFNNILKHAKATKVLININFDESTQTLNIQIVDNGIGFDLNKSKYGKGISNIKKRIEKIKGKLDIQGRPNKGTQITIDVLI